MRRNPASIIEVTDQEYSDLQGRLEPGAFYRVVDRDGKVLRLLTPSGEVVGVGEPLSEAPFPLAPSPLRRVQAETTALLARMTVQPSAAKAAAINRLITRLKDEGVWSQLDALYVLCAHDSQAAYRNWIADSFNLTASGGTFTANYGWASDGVGAYLDTGFNPATASSPKFTQNSATFGLVSRGFAQVEGANIMGQYDGTQGCSIVTRNSSPADATSYRINQASRSDISGSLSGQGVFGINRTGATSTQLYVDGYVAASGATASVAVVSQNFWIGRISSSIAGGTAPIAAAWIGGSLTAAQHKALAAALNEYLDASTVVSVSPTWTSSAQTFMGGYIEIQPDSFNGGTSRPATDSSTDTWGFPHSLTSSEQNRLRDLLVPGGGYGIHYLRLPLGFAYRGLRNLDPVSGLARNVGERYPGINASIANLLANVVEAGGGLAPEYWGVPPHWTTTGLFGGQSGTTNTLTAGGAYPRSTTLASIRVSDPTQYAAQINAFTNAILDDLEYLHTNVAPVRMYGLQNEPQFGDLEYGSCQYTDQVYSDVLASLQPKVAASAVLSTWRGRSNTPLLHIGSDDTFDIGASYIAANPSKVWGYTYHRITEIGNDAAWIKNSLFTIKGSKPNCWVNETEYFTPSGSTDEWKTANNMLRDVFNLAYGNAPVSMPIIHIAKQIGATGSNSNTSGYALVECNLPSTYGAAPGASTNQQPSLGYGNFRPVRHNYNAHRFLADNLPVGAVRVGGEPAGLPQGVGFVAFTKDGQLRIFMVNRNASAVRLSLTLPSAMTLDGLLYNYERAGSAIGSVSGESVVIDVPALSGVVYKQAK